MSAKKVAIIALAVLLSMQFAVVSVAAEDAQVIQAYCRETQVDLFLTGIAEQPDELSVHVARQECEMENSGFLRSAEIPVYTLLLVDVSTSMRATSQSALKQLLETLISQKASNDQIALYSFGEEVRLLCDFGQDRWDLAKAAEGLLFEDKESSLYDAVKQMVEVLAQLKKDRPIFAQMVVISDGVEQSATGITKDELFFLIKNNPYPIHTYGFKYERNAEGLKELATLSRMSGAEYREIGSRPDIEALAEAIVAFPQRVFWVESLLPDDVLDGSTQSVALTLRHGGAETTVVHEVKMPFVAQESVSSSVSSVSPSTTSSSPSSVSVSMPMPAPQPSSGVPWVWIVVGVLAAGACVFIVLMIARKKKSSISQPQEEKSYEDDLANKTLIEIADDGNKTQLLINSPGDASGGSVTLILLDLQRTNKRFVAVLNHDVIVGRDKPDCDIVIDYDKSVSRQHCKIYAAGGHVWVKDLGSSNKTFLNGEPVTTTMMMKSKDVLRVGKVEFVVTIEAR